MTDPLRGGQSEPPAALRQPEPYTVDVRGASVRVPASIIATAYLIFGLGLWLQPDRWQRTPAYGILLDMFPQQTWGTLYIIVALTLLAAVWFRATHTIAIMAHIAAVALTTVWFTAFVIRWVTDSSTTVVNVVNWAVLLSVLIYSISLIDRRADTHIIT